MAESGFTHESTANKTQEWYTPKYIFDALGLTFDLDVASPGAGVVPWVPATYHYTKKENGLWKPWAGCVWMNPPYGQQTPKWLKKFVEHRNGVALVFSRTDTRWFHDYVGQTDGVLFLRGRVVFVSPGKEAGTPGSGSMLVACGEDCCKALLNSGLGIYFDMKNAVKPVIKSSELELE